MKIDVLMSNVEKGNEIIEHISFKRGLRVIEHVVCIPFIDLHSYYQIIDKKSFHCANLIKECTASNINIITFKPNKVSTSNNEDKLDLVGGIVGASNAIFMIKVWYRQDMFDRTDHRNPSCFNVP
jgi:hypothetical protein